MEMPVGLKIDERKPGEETVVQCGEAVQLIVRFGTDSQDRKFSLEVDVV